MRRITDGKKAIIETTMLIFKNDRRSYPIRGVVDNVPGVKYSTGPKGWMDKEVFKQWLSEPRAIKLLPNNEWRILFVDNVLGTPLNRTRGRNCGHIRRTIQKFPPNARHLIQLADSFIIQKVKCAWPRGWDEYKRKCIEDNLWTIGSGKMPNPGKTFYLKLAAATVRDFMRRGIKRVWRMQYRR